MYRYTFYQPTTPQLPYNIIKMFQDNSPFLGDLGAGRHASKSDWIRPISTTLLKSHLNATSQPQIPLVKVNILPTKNTSLPPNIKTITQNNILLLAV